MKTIEAPQLPFTPITVFFYSYKALNCVLVGVDVGVVGKRDIRIIEICLWCHCCERSVSTEAPAKRTVKPVGWSDVFLGRYGKSARSAQLDDVNLILLQLGFNQTIENNLPFAVQESQIIRL